MPEPSTASDTWARSGTQLYHHNGGALWDVATGLLEKADTLCPYARMAWRGTPTTITLAS